MTPAFEDAGPVLVVGATGRIGREVTRHLLAAGRPVRALVRPASAAGSSLIEDVEIARGELGDATSIDTAISGIGACFVAVRDHPDQAQWETALIDALERRAPVPVVKISAFAASLSPPPGYGRIHAAVERRLAASTLPWTVLQPYMYMQNFLELARPVGKLGRVPLPLGRGRVAFIDARDVAHAAAAILLRNEHTQQSHVLTGPEALDGEAVARQMSAVLDRRVRYSAVPPSLAATLMRMAGVSGWDVSMRAELFAMLRADGEATVNGNYSRLTGAEPTSLQRFLVDHRSVFAG